MPRIGITGHSNLSAESVPLVAEAIRKALEEHDSAKLTGVSCLAPGADQVFAVVVIGIGGTLDVVLPAADYRATKVEPGRPAALFDCLIAHARDVHTMPFPQSNRDAYMAASEHVLSTVDEMLAVWDGESSDRHGSTGAVVMAALSRGIPVTVIWPHGAQRDG